jgi:nucleotide-binding universal stress UspA family protein
MKILVTLDGSPAAEAVLPAASALARSAGASVTLLMVCSPPAGVSAPPPSPPRPAAMGQFVEPVVDIQRTAATESPAPIESRGQAIARVEAEAGDYLAGVASRLRDGGLGVELSVLMDADVPAAIVRFARERGFDIVAMSTHGRSGLREVISGSVASAVLRAGALPVLLVRPGK